MNSKPFIFFILILLLAGISSADAPPPIPCEYHGTLTIGGVPAPVGTIIQTKVYGIVRAEEVTTDSGYYQYLVAQMLTVGPDRGRDLAFSPDGNQVAVFPEPAGRDTETMQAITREMAYSECTFVFPAEDARPSTAARHEGFFNADTRAHRDKEATR